MHQSATACGQQLPLAAVDAAPQRRRVVLGFDRHRRLEDDRPAVRLAAIEQLDGAAGDLHAARERLLDGVHAAAERREQRRVHVEDGVGKRVEELVAEDAVVPGADDQANARGAECDRASPGPGPPRRRRSPTAAAPPR